MAADSDVSISQIDTQFDRLSATSEESTLRGYLDQDLDQIDEDTVRNWGFRLKDLYRLALRFYKEKEGKAINLSYHDKLKVVALTKQIKVGKFNAHTSPPLGVLDVIGRDRRIAWQSLGDMSAEGAMLGFIELLDSRCNLFRPFIEAHKADLENRIKVREENEKLRKENDEKCKLEEELKVKNGEDELKVEEQKRLIQEALNQQTYVQFKAYAEQHFPGDQVQQERLVKQLQEEHYQQYMEQLAREREQGGGSEDAALQTVPVSNGALPGYQSSGECEALRSVYPDHGRSPPTALSTASMWTRKDVREFKESIRKEGGDSSIIRVGHGETVTVRVPTNEEGNCLFWEFATDYYDIGFGVYFEWTKSPTSQVSVHVSESEDEDDYPNDEDEEEDEDEAGEGLGDVERGVAASRLDPSRPPISVVIPVYRRDCQEQVYAGSHTYPGVGVYLLKFDNSYSLWRSKTLYYKIYYTR